jgi:hypothetical protein
MDAPELVDYVETHNFTIEMSERPQRRHARPGYWRTLAHKLAMGLAPTPRERYTPACKGSHPFETPMDQLVREHPSLSVYALALI